MDRHGTVVLELSGSPGGLSLDPASEGLEGRHHAGQAAVQELADHQAKRAVAGFKALLVDHREVLEMIPDQLVENGLLRVSRSVESRSLPDHRLLDCLLEHGRKGVARGGPGARRF